VERQHVAGDDVDVGLGELPEPALLWALPAPYLLDLPPAERELQLAGVLQDVPRERDGQVVVQRQLGGLGVGRSESLDGIDLLVDLALAQQDVERLDGAGLDVGEAVQLERPAQVVEHLLLDGTLTRKELGET
jgi:hypothetical protein